MENWCGLCRYEDYEVTEEPCNNCVKYFEEMPAEFFPKRLHKPKTNADRIRAMSDEELAEWIDHIQADAYERGLMETPVVDYPNIYSGWLDWLVQEVSDGDLR